MADEILTGQGDFSWITDLMTDYGSPGHEDLMDAVRIGIETLKLDIKGAGESGALTSDPTDVANSVCTDSGKSWTTNEWDGFTLVFTSGNAKGKEFEILSNTATALTVSGNAYTQGARSADDYQVIHDNLNQTSGHDHDGINSPAVVLQDSQVTQAKLATGTSSGTVSNSTDATMTGGTYSFYPRTAAAASTNSVTMSRKYHASAATYIGYEGASGSALWNNRYITSSGEIYWIFLLRNKTNGEIEASSFANDHVCFGNSGNPILVPHPFDGFDPSTHEVIVINPEIDQVRELYSKMREPVAFNDVGNELKAQLRKNFDNNYLVNQVILKKDIFNIAQIWLNEYSLNETTRPKFPTKEVTVDLPFEDKFDAQRFLGQKVETIKRQIPEPKNILTARLI